MVGSVPITETFTSSMKISSLVLRVAKIIIINEATQCCHVTLIDNLLREIMCNESLLRGKVILLVGDIGQTNEINCTQRKWD